MPIRLSYIVISWNGIDLLSHLLQSLRTQLQRADAEMILVDNGSTDGTCDYIRQHYPEIRLVALTENKGVAAARNIGLQMARGEYLLILDNDIIANDLTIAAMEQYMDANEQVGLCAPRLCFPNGDLQNTAKKYPGLWVKIHNLLSRQTVITDYPAEMAAGLPFEPEYVIGACQMIRREAFLKAGLLDEHIFYGPEDCDYCIRIRLAGYKVVYLPQVNLIHECQRRTRRNPFSKLGIAHIKALAYFYMKYKRFF